MRYPNIGVGCEYGWGRVWRGLKTGVVREFRSIPCNGDRSTQPNLTSLSPTHTYTRTQQHLTNELYKNKLILILIIIVGKFVVVVDLFCIMKRNDLENKLFNRQLLGERDFLFTFYDDKIFFLNLIKWVWKPFYWHKNMFEDSIFIMIARLFDVIFQLKLVESFVCQETICIVIKTVKSRNYVLIFAILQMLNLILWIQ